MTGTGKEQETPERFERNDPRNKVYKQLESVKAEIALTSTVFVGSCPNTLVVLHFRMKARHKKTMKH